MCLEKIEISVSLSQAASLTKRPFISFECISHGTLYDSRWNWNKSEFTTAQMHIVRWIQFDSFPPSLHTAHSYTGKLFGESASRTCRCDTALDSRRAYFSDS